MNEYLNILIQYKKQISYFLLIFIVILGFYFILGLFQGNKEANVNLKSVVNTGSTSITTISTPLPENFDEKLKQEGRLKEIDLSFNKNGFFDKDQSKLNYRANIKAYIDASNTGLPDGTVLSLLISGTDINTEIITPGRYKFSFYFKNEGINDVIITGSGIENGSITKKVELK